MLLDLDDVDVYKKPRDQVHNMILVGDYRFCVTVYVMCLQGERGTSVKLTLMRLTTSG